MPPVLLTKKIIRDARPQSKRYDVRDAVEGVRGLLLRVEPDGQKTFYIDYRIGGKRNTKKIGLATILTLEQARQLAKEKLAEIALGDNPFEKKQDNDNITLRQFIELYYKSNITNMQKSEETVYFLTKFFPDIIDTPMKDITADMIRKWQSEQLDSGSKRSTVNRKLSSIKGAFRWAFDNNIIEKNELAKVKRLPETDSNAIVRYLTDEEINKLLSVLNEREKEKGKKDHLKPLMLLSLNTGLRRKTALNLLWEDIDFNTRTIRLRKEIIKTSDLRYIPMNDIVYKTLLEWKVIVKKSALIFPSPKIPGQPMRDCNSSFERVLKTAGIEHFRWHDLRHSFASHLIQDGQPIEVVSSLLCHGSVKTTQKYAHLQPRATATAVERLNKLYDKKE